MEIKPENLVAIISRIRERVDRMMVSELERHNIQGLVPSHGLLMANLFRQKQMTMTELAKSIDRDKSTVTALVDKLVSLGYVEKVKDDGDQRVTWVKATAKGKQMIPAFKAMRRTYMETLYRGISEQDQETLVRLLARVKDNL